eukprot:301666-Ditylum_brightwellii.AAC.1
MAIVWAQHQSGMLEPVLWEIKSPLPHLGTRWIPSLCTYLGTTELHLQLSYTGAYPSQHVSDQHIMSTVIDSNAFKPYKVKRIKCCRLYLGATMLSDVTLADRVALDPHMQSDNISILSSSAKQLLSKQGHPNKKSWKMWTKCLNCLQTTIN